MFKTLASLFLIFISPLAQANFYHEEVQRLFSELETLGQSPTSCDQVSFEGDDPSLYHQQVQLPFQDLERQTYNGVEVSVMTPEQAEEFFRIVSALDYIDRKSVV